MTNYFLNTKSIYCLDTGETVLGYKNYLQSSHWLKLRARLVKPNTKCRHCEEKKPVLHLHHLHYNTIGREDADNDLVVLCEDCHKLFHKADYKPSKEKSKNGKGAKKGKLAPTKGKRGYNCHLDRVESVSERMYRNIFQSVMKLDKQHMTMLRDSLNEKITKS